MILNNCLMILLMTKLFGELVSKVRKFLCVMSILFPTIKSFCCVFLYISYFSAAAEEKGRKDDAALVDSDDENAVLILSQGGNVNPFLPLLFLILFYHWFLSALLYFSSLSIYHSKKERFDVIYVSGDLLIVEYKLPGFGSLMQDNVDENTIV